MYFMWKPIAVYECGKRNTRRHFTVRKAG